MFTIYLQFFISCPSVHTAKVTTDKDSKLRFCT